MYMLGFSATPMLTACYGMPYDVRGIDPTPFDDICGTVYDAETHKPIPGIKVSVPTLDISTVSDSEGRYHLDHFFDTSVRVIAEDIDGKENGDYYDSAQIVTVDDNLNTNFSMRKRE